MINDTEAQITVGASTLGLTIAVVLIVEIGLTHDLCFLAFALAAGLAMINDTEDDISVNASILGLALAVVLIVEVRFSDDLFFLAFALAAGLSMINEPESYITEFVTTLSLIQNQRNVSEKLVRYWLSVPPAYLDV